MNTYRKLFAVAVVIISLGLFVMMPYKNLQKENVSMKYSIETLVVPYAQLDGRELKLLITRPKAKGLFPALLDVHGGGWKHFDHSVDFYWCEELASRGFVTAAVEFRLDQWPHHISDIRAAFRWLSTHGTDYGIDTSKIGAIGGSTGGHLPLVLGLLPNDARYPITPALNTPDSVNNQLQWIVSFYPIVDVPGRYQMVKNTNFSPLTLKISESIHTFLSRRLEKGEGASKHKLAEFASPVPRLRKLQQFKQKHPTLGNALGWVLARLLNDIGRIPALKVPLYEQLALAHELTFLKGIAEMEEASPLHIVQQNKMTHLPPVVIVQGIHDPNVTPQMTQSFVDAYRKAGGWIEFHLWQGFAHSFANIPSPQSDQAINTAERFIRQVLIKSNKKSATIASAA